MPVTKVPKGTLKAQVLWVHCNDCGRETKHDIVHRADRGRSYDEGQYTVEVGSVWKVLQCCGCEEVSMQRVDWCSEDDPTDGPGPGVFFPPRVSRRKPNWSQRNEVPAEYVGLLEEIYTALHADSRRLAMMGARAVIDAYIRRNVGPQQNFPQGLDALVAKSLMSDSDRKVVEAAVDVGHASAHRGHNPAPKSADVVMDIVERLVQTELLAQQAKQLQRSTPRRKRPAKKK